MFAFVFVTNYYWMKSRKRRRFIRIECGKVCVNFINQNRWNVESRCRFDEGETSTYSDGLVLVAKVSLYQVDIVVWLKQSLAMESLCHLVLAFRTVRVIVYWDKYKQKKYINWKRWYKLSIRVNCSCFCFKLFSHEKLHVINVLLYFLSSCQLIAIFVQSFQFQSMIR